MGPCGIFSVRGSNDSSLSCEFSQRKGMEPLRKYSLLLVTANTSTKYQIRMSQRIGVNNNNNNICILISFGSIAGLLHILDGNLTCQADRNVKPSSCWSAMFFK